MTQTEKFQRFKKHLRDGNVEGVKETFEPEFLEEMIDDYSGRRPIHFACENENFEIVKLLIDYKYNIESEDKEGRRLIHFTCENGNFEIVKMLIEKKCNIESEDKDEKRPIHFACESGNPEILKLLIEHKCNIESEDKNGKRPIHFACEGGNFNIVKLLIENKCNIEIEDKDGKRPIHFACLYGNFEIVNHLIENKCNIESEDKEGRRLTHFSCSNGNFQIVKLLIENKYDIESEDKDGKRPIHFACKSGNFEIMKLLIENKYNIESEDRGGRRLIHFACNNGNFEIVKLLIENKCNIESKDKWGKRAIHFACKSDNLEIVKLLIKNKCNIESDDKWGWRPIQFACSYNNLEIVKLLIENKCNIESENLEGRRPIHFTCLYNNFEMVKLFIDKKCNIESEDKEGMRPIHFACLYNNLEIMKLLIENKCNIESEDKWGKRPIHLVCENGHIEIVKMLIFLNCLINVKDKDGKTPLDLAKKKGHGEIVKLISKLDKVTKQFNGSILKNDDGTFAKYYNSDLHTGLHWVELARVSNANKIIKYFLNRPIDAAEISYLKEGTKYVMQQSAITNLWEEVLLYKCIKQHHEDGFKLVCKPITINRPQRIIPCSFLELAAQNGNSVLVEEILRKSIYNSETWEKAKNIALQNHHQHIYDSISKREYLLKIRQKMNFSILHTAVCDNHPDMIEYILSQGLVDPNENHETFGTALSFAIQLCHVECLRVLERFNISYNTQNKYLQTPLHEASSNDMIKHCQYLMDRVENIDQPGFMGLTALHYAVMRGCEKLCKQLVEKGADCNLYAKFCQTLTEKKGIPISNDPLSLSRWENPLTLCVKMNKTIYSCFLNSIDRDKANSCDDKGNSLLHLTAKLLEPKLCNVLLQAGANVDTENRTGNTPMFVLLSSLNENSFTFNEDEIIEIVNLFVQCGCELNKSLKGDVTLFNLISKFNCERLFLALLPEQQNQFYEIDENIFKIVLDKHFYRFCEGLINIFPKDILKSSISINVIEAAVKQDCTNILKSLVINADNVVQQIVSELSLYLLATMNDKESFECLLNIEVNNPLCFKNGETLLTRLLKEKKFDFCKQIIESQNNNKKYINFKNEKHQTPLQVAIKTESMNIVHSLIFGIENIDNVDSKGHTALSQLFAKISDNDKKEKHLDFLNAIKAIISEGGDIYHENSQRVKAIEYCSSVEVRNSIVTFFKNKQDKKGKIIEKEKLVFVKEIELEKRVCGVCLDREVDSVFECGHTICKICSEQIVRCPFCNIYPVHAKRIFFN